MSFTQIVAPNWLSRLPSSYPKFPKPMIPAVLSFSLRGLVNRRSMSCHWSIAQSAGFSTNSVEALATVRLSSVMFGAPDPQPVSWRNLTELGTCPISLSSVSLSVTTTAALEILSVKS